MHHRSAVLLLTACAHHAPSRDAAPPAGHPCVDTVVSATNDLSHVKGGVIAFTRRDAAGKLQIVTANPDGTNLNHLTTDGDNGLPAWSRDGKKIAFMAIRDGGAPSIAVMDADGSNQHVIVPNALAPDWSPDGTRIAYHRGDGQIWTIAPDGTGERPITSTPTYKVRPSWSPDGAQLAFMEVGDPSSPDHPKPQIGILNADGSNEHLITVVDRTNVCTEADGTTRVLETAHDANAAQWSPVDDRIAFWSGIETQYGQVWTIHADETASTQLTAETRHSNNDDPSWSPDGTKVLFSTGRSGQNELWVMDPDGGNEMRLFAIDAAPTPGRGAWQPLPD